MRRITVAIAALAFGLGLAAHAGAQDVIDARWNTMKGFGKSMGTIKDNLGDPAKVAVEAASINAGAKKIPSLFPEGVGHPKSRQTPKIWEDWAGFQAAAKRLEDESAKLEMIAASGDAAAIPAQFGAMGKSGCGGCHETYRGPKKE